MGDWMLTTSVKPEQLDLFGEYQGALTNRARKLIQGRDSRIEEDCEQLLVSLLELGVVSQLSFYQQKDGLWHAGCVVTMDANDPTSMRLDVDSASSLRAGLRELLFGTQLYVSTKSIHSQRGRG